MTRLMRRYPQAPQLFRRVSKESAASDNGVGNDGLGVTHFENALHLHSEERDALLFIKTAANRKMNSTKQKRAAVLLGPRTFVLELERSWKSGKLFTGKRFQP